MTLIGRKLLRNAFKWALKDSPPVDVKGSGILDVTTWRQEKSMTVHLVNFTNPMMMKGPIRELLPVGAQELTIKIPAGASVKGVKLLVSGETTDYDLSDGNLKLTIPRILDHEVVAVNLG